LSRSVLRGFGLATAALVAAVTFGSPAYAADTGTIAGTITDAGGTPVPNASVSVMANDESFSRSVKTDTEGHYSLVGVPVGPQYLVAVEAAQHPRQYAHDKTDWSLADRFAVTAGGVTTIDESFLPTGTISGRFTDNAGAGVAYAYVEASGDGGGSWANTEADGAYTMAVLPGSYRVSFYSNGLTQYAFGTFSWEAATVFTVGVGQTVTVNDTTVATGSVGGHITYADGSPAAYVTISTSDGPTTGWAQTHYDGSYQMNGLPSGDYRVSVQLPSGATEWIPQKLVNDQGQLFHVTGDAVTTVDERLLGIGSIAGRFTDAGGTGMAGLEVQAIPAGTYWGSYAYTNDDGLYRFDQIFAGDYQIGFHNWETNFSQWAYGKTSEQAADTITVTEGQTTTVNDSRLPTGSLRITATDALTGAPLQSFSVYVNNGSHGGETTTGDLVISDLPAGQYQVTVTADGYAAATQAATVTIVAGEQANVSVALQPRAKITTKVVDKKTGLPVSGVCVFTASSTAFAIPDGCRRSDANGDVTLELPQAGTYNLFALPNRGAPYGAQWVSAKGGTGSQAGAAAITVAAGQSVAAPTVTLDRPGTIAGKVTSSTGTPLSRGFVGIVGPDFGVGIDTRYSPIAADGSYTVDWLGPYKWPLFFTASDHAGQWSGGTGNRLAADLVQVRPGQTTAYDYTMQQGTSVKITLADSDGGRFLIHDAVTGDILYVRDSSGSPATADVWILGGQQVKLHCYCAENIWHGGTDFASATAVTIPATGPLEIAFQRG